MWADFIVKLNVIKSKNFTEYIAKRLGNKFARCIAYKKYKGLPDAHPIGTESHNRHQHKYIEHVNNEEAHRQDYHKNRALSIMRPIEVLTIYHNKMDYAKTACPSYAREINAIYEYFNHPIVVMGLWCFHIVSLLAQEQICTSYGCTSANVCFFWVFLLIICGKIGFVLHG